MAVKSLRIRGAVRAMATDRAAGQERRLAGRYRLGRVLGSGGGGVVREGEDTLLRRRVAIKEVRRPPVASPAERAMLSERVLHEARAAARLRHPGLVTVYDVFDAEHHTWIVMEYVDGASLADLIRAAGRLPALEVARVGVSLAYALEAAHRGGVVHRDVKPGNVLVTADGQARLTDFGIAVTEGDATLTEAGMLVGSPAYIAPERARGARVGAAGDVWGLGATLFTAVEGVPPFEGEGRLAILAAVVEDRRRPFQHSGPLRGVLTELLDSDPARRGARRWPRPAAGCARSPTGWRRPITPSAGRWWRSRSPTSTTRTHRRRRRTGRWPQPRPRSPPWPAHPRPRRPPGRRVSPPRATDPPSPAAPYPPPTSPALPVDRAGMLRPPLPASPVSSAHRAGMVRLVPPASLVRSVRLPPRVGPTRRDLTRIARRVAGVSCCLPGSRWRCSSPRRSCSAWFSPTVARTRPRRPSPRPRGPPPRRRRHRGHR